MKRSNNAKRGTATVEFALALPVLLLFFTVSVEFARCSIIRHVLDNASYEACRTVIVPGGTNAEAIAKATSMLTAAGITNPTITISPNPIVESSTNVVVQISVPTTGNTWGAARFTSGKTLTAVTKLLTERTPTFQVAGMPVPPPDPTPAPEPAPAPATTTTTTSSTTTTAAATTEVAAPAPAPGPVLPLL